MKIRRDIKKHNEEVKLVWDSFKNNKPVRVPVTLGICIRYYMPIPEANPHNIWYEEYTNDPDKMLEMQLTTQKWARENINYCCDNEVGIPEKFWAVGIDFQNFYEGAWFGAPLHFIKGQVPDVRPIITDDKKNILFDKGMPDPLNGPCMSQVKQYYEYWSEKLRNFEFCGKPVKVTGLSGLCTDGILTTATQLRGGDLFADIYLDPEFVKKLLNFITDCTIKRINAWKKYLGSEFPGNWWDGANPEGTWGFGDDSIELISGEIYEEFVLPCHKRLFAEYGWKGPNFIHLCGDAQRHFKIIRDELKVMTFDTGFPIDFRKLRGDLDDDVTIYGGIHIEKLKNDTPKEVEAEAKRILQSGIMHGGKFILREANNLAPGTPLENIMAMYNACKKYGKY
jgi:uroporphyrinogen-III decarboxylase